jgi:molybdate transport system permease protein
MSPPVAPQRNDAATPAKPGSAVRLGARAADRLLPIGQGVLAVAAVVLLVVPLVGLALSAPWSEMPELIASPEVASALRLSLVTSLAALALSTLLGVPLAWVLARRRFRGRTLLRTVAVLPMVLPPVAAGLGLLLAFGRRGVLGGPLAALSGVTIPFTTAAVVIAEAFVAMPFLVVTLEAGLASLDPGYEQAAETLGASRLTVLRRVTLPLIRPSLAAGMALCWARALGEFGATITFAGNLEGVTQTMPLAVYLQLQTDPAAAYLIALVLLAVSVVVLVALRGRLVVGH